MLWAEPLIKCPSSFNYNMKYILLSATCLITSCASTKSDWSELMRREDLQRVNSQTYVSDMNTTYVTNRDVKFFLELILR